VNFELRDYRDVSGRYDHIVSIEMIEAVGERYWPAYFATIARALVPGGRACVQAITIDDRRFDRYRSGTDFIQQYIFPGGMLPSPSRFRADAAGQGLAVTGDHAFGRDYAETLRRWRETFLHRAADVRALGYDERFIRMWDFYLAYCEAGFDTLCTDVHQFELKHAA
jgi:cyclopropane-fatty-acyl-phospholipid synthase